jgi:exopolyphosphatase / guanosine-5'-triphosphate,3'-diphosphate pyrophosphatase
VPFTVVARCGIGHPLVIQNRPLDAAGNPFPTVYWLTCPEAVKAVSGLESEGWIKRLEGHAEIDPELRTGLRRAHEEYARERGRVHPGAEAWGGVGGAARGIKCLHAHFAHHLAGGPDPIGAWVADRVDVRAIHYEKPARRLAVIDQGTNTTRLLVARFVQGEPELHDLARDVIVTRLGEGVDASGQLHPRALRRALDVVERYARRARALGAERIRLSATSAVRDASNRQQLAGEVGRLVGEPMEVLTGEQEAATSFAGATRGLKGHPPPYLVLDIGGGSTEFVLGERDPDPSASASTRIGNVRMTERHVHSDPPSYKDMEAVELEIDQVLTETEDAVPVHDAETLVALGGTSTTVLAIALGLAEYDPEAIHQRSLDRDDAERVFRLLADMTTEERRGIPVMQPGRADVIVAGTAILVGVMRRWGFAQAVVSETDILDGLAYRLAEEPAGGE